MSDDTQPDADSLIPAVDPPAGEVLVPKVETTSAPPPVRWCDCCKNLVPLSDFSVTRNRSEPRRAGQPIYSTTCVPCQQKIRKEAKERKVIGDRDEFFNEMSRRLMGHADDAPVVSEWCATVLAALGGMEEAAYEYAAYIQRLAKNEKTKLSATLGRQFEALSKLIAVSTAQRADAADLEAMSEEEAIAKFKRILLREVSRDPDLARTVVEAAGIDAATAASLARARGLKVIGPDLDDEAEEVRDAG